MNTVPEELGTEYYRSFLSDQGKNCYDTLRRRFSVNDYCGSCSFHVWDYDSAASDCFKAYEALRDDHPEFFFLGPKSSFFRYGDWASLRYQVLYSRDEIQRMQRQVNTYIRNLVKGAAKLTPIDGEILVYERIAKSLSYDKLEGVSHTVIGPVLHGSGCCEGINALLLQSLRSINIPCIKAVGESTSGGAHCWSIVWLDGKPVHCDVTWDKPRGKNNEVLFKYLNLSDRQIAADHCKFNNQIPACSSEEFNFVKDAFQRNKEEA